MSFGSLLMRVQLGHECYVEKVKQKNISFFLGAKFYTNAKK
jgi:hypothetical protein